MPLDPTAKLILGTGAVLAAPLFAGAFLAGAVSSAAPAPRAVTAEAGPAVLTTVANRTDRRVRVTVRVRPPGDAVASGPLTGAASAFTLAPHDRRTIRLTPRP